jgi:hypothetical protein
MSREVSSWSVSGPAAVSGVARVPGDKSISHRALMLGAVAEGVTEVSGLSAGLDVRCTADALWSMGVEIRQEGMTVLVTGANDELHEPEGSLDPGQRWHRHPASLRSRRWSADDRHVDGGRVLAVATDGPGHRALARDGRRV